MTERVSANWAGTRACCLLHRRLIFWHHDFRQWVHTNCYPCESMEGEPDPTGWSCRYCGTRLAYEGGGRLWALVPEADRHPYWEKWTEYVWQPPREKYRWHEDAWTDKCPISPTFRHHVGPLRFT